MTVQTTSRVAIYQGNGVTVDFPFNFRIPAAANLSVSLQDWATKDILEVISPGAYTVVGIGDDDGGTVTYNPGTPLTSSYGLVILRTMPYTQDMDIENQGGFFPEVVEQQLDFIVMQIQQLAEEQSRAITVNPGEDPLTFIPGTVGDMLVLGPDGTIITVPPASGGLGDMLRSVYDPQGNLGDAFDRKKWGSFDTEAQFVAQSIKAPVLYVDVAGYSAKGDRGAYRALRITTPSPVEPWNLQSADGAWWEKQGVNGVIRPEMFGAFPHLEVDAATTAWYNALSVKSTASHVIHHDYFNRRLKWRDLWNGITCILAIGSENLADAGINARNPGTLNATVLGGGTHIPAVGLKGNGTNAYMRGGAWSSLVSQNGAFFASSYLVNDDTSTLSLLATDVGFADGIAFSPKTASNLISYRANSAATITYSGEPFRQHFTPLINRSSALTSELYLGGELAQATGATASIAPTANTMTVLRSGTTYATETVRMVVTGNVSLNANKADALTVLIDDYVEGLPGAVGKGPSAASIGFTQRTTPAAMATTFDTITRLAQRLGAKVEFGLGMYITNNSYPICRGVETYGVDMRCSIIRLAAGTAKTVPVYAPRHFNGGEKNSCMHNLTLDGATSARGYTDRTPQPGGSGISTFGTQDGLFYDVIILDPHIHGVDICNTGELDLGGVRQYAFPSNAARRSAGVSSSGWKIWNVYIENMGDDAFTTHYSHDCVAWNIKAFFHSGRGDDTASMGCEIDDGSYNITVYGVLAHAVPHVCAIKCHADHPPPSNCHIYDATGVMCPRGCAIYSSAGVGVGNFGEDNSIEGLDFTRPAFYTAQEVTALYINNMKNTTARRIRASGRLTDVTGYYRGIYVSGSNVNTLIDDFEIRDWVTDVLIIPEGDTLRITGGSADTTIKNGRVVNAGKRAFWDSGSSRFNYENITITGTSVSASEGFRIDDLTAFSSFEDIKVISGFTTPRNLPPPPVFIASATVAGQITVPYYTTGLIRIGGFGAAPTTGVGGANSDLATINGGEYGQQIILKAADSSIDIVVKHGTGNILLNGLADFTLNNGADMLMLIYNNGNWVAQAPGSNNAT